MKEPESGLSFKSHLSANIRTALLVSMTDFVFRNELLSFKSSSAQKATGTSITIAVQIYYKTMNDCIRAVAMHLSTFRTYIHQVPPSPSIYQGSEVPCDIFSEQSCNPLSVSTMPERSQQHVNNQNTQTICRKNLDHDFKQSSTTF